MKSCDLTIVTTALNEEQNVSLFLDRLRNFLENSSLDYEVIFVDDGSTDKTFVNAMVYSDWDRLRVIRLQQNAGTGAAIKHALSVATGKWYTWIPSDLEINPSSLAEPIKIRNGHDIIVTYFQDTKNRSVSRRLLSKAFTLVINLAFNLRLPYYNGITLMRINQMPFVKVRSNGFFFHAELLLRSALVTNKIATCQIDHSPRNQGKTKAIKLKVFYDVAVCFSRLWWELRLKHSLWRQH
jgi:glycosyltransferase involved in cell wall biosynthesis